MKLLLFRGDLAVFTVTHMMSPDSERQPSLTVTHQRRRARARAPRRTERSSAGLSFLQAECAGQDHTHTTADSPQLLLDKDKEDVSISGSRHSSPAAAAPKARCWFFLSQPVRFESALVSLSSCPVLSCPDGVGVFPLLSFSEGCSQCGRRCCMACKFLGHCHSSRRLSERACYHGNHTPPRCCQGNG